MYLLRVVQKNNQIISFDKGVNNNFDNYYLILSSKVTFSQEA